jgi:hypothetical protein
MTRHQSGIYFTYVAASGAGYVRVLTEEARSMVESLPAAERDRQFLYMEHLTIHFGSITYFGK